jgi:anthranilate phosphoribosyltransferase
LIGAYDVAAAELMANTLVGLSGERAWVVHGAAGWDEATPIGPFLAFDVAAGRVRRERIDPEQFGLPRCSAADLKGADAAANLAALRAVFEGRDRGAHRSALLLQSGLALFIAGRAGSPAAGIARAGETLDSGRAAEWLERLQQFARAAGAARSEQPA